MPPSGSRRALPLLLTAVLVMVAGCAAPRAPDQGAPPSPSVRDPASGSTGRQPAPGPTERRPPVPDLSVTAFDGRTITLGAFRGRPVVVNFFESW